MLMETSHALCIHKQDACRTGGRHAAGREPDHLRLLSAGPQETAISFMQAVARGDYDQAIAMIDIPDDVRNDQRKLEDSRAG